MGKSTAWENGLLLLLFNNTAFANVGDVGGLQPSAVPGTLYLSLHTADPTAAGNQSSNEMENANNASGYVGYARVGIARSGAGWVVTTNSVSPAALASFPAGGLGTGIATYFGVGTDAAGAGTLLYSGAIAPTIQCGPGITPQLTTASAVTES